jgi:hypothetical protein
MKVLDDILKKLRLKCHKRHKTHKKRINQLFSM